MYNTAATIACVIAGLVIITTIVLLVRSLWKERHQWREQDEAERREWEESE